MKIAATTVSMDAARNYTEVEQNNTVWQRGNSAPFSFGQTSRSPSEKSFQDSLFTLINSSSTSQQYGTCSVTSLEEVAGHRQVEDSPAQEEAQQQAFSAMVEQITGSSVNVQQVVYDRRSQPDNTNSGPFSARLASLSSSAIHVEQESVCFQAEGTVETECGRSISFNMGLQMERQDVFYQASAFDRILQGIDPLVLNFDENIALSDQNYFSFDLDADGSCEEVPGLASGCGFLALDRNGDGSITDGLELFGPSTGYGFAELAALDTDRNMWIDENDPIFDELLIWMEAGGEDEQLVSLRDAGVGAISVAHLGTEFTLEDREGLAQGLVQASGLFLMENGEPRTLLEIDLIPGGNETATVAAEGEDVAKNFGLDARAQTAIENLREIIFWQRLKMEMALGRKQLTSPREEMLARLQRLSDGLGFSMLEKPGFG